MSLRKSTCSSVMSAGIFIGPTSAYGTRTNSACPPSKPPVVWEYPNTPDATDEFGFEFSQLPVRPRVQKRQVPHEILNGTTTRSPGTSDATEEPISSTTPAN